MVTGISFSYPSTLRPRESPTSSSGMPAASRIRAVGWSYAVSIGNRFPCCFHVRRSCVVTAIARASFLDRVHGFQAAV